MSRDSSPPPVPPASPSPSSAPLPATPPMEYLEGDTVVRAGAGTGKTHSLTTVVVHLLGGLTTLREPVAPEEITAVTFTEAAAAEMRERIQARVMGLARAEAASDAAARDRALLAAAARDLAVAEPTPGFWQDLLPRLERLRVTTFHGWAYGILRAHAPAAGLDPDLEVLDENQTNEFWQSLIEELLLSDLESEDSAALQLVRHYGYGRRDSQAGNLASWIRDLVQALREEGSDASRLTADGRYDAELMRRRLTDTIADLRGALNRIGALVGRASKAKAAAVAAMGVAGAADEEWTEQNLGATLDKVGGWSKGNWGSGKSPLYAPLQEVKKELQLCREALADLQAAPLVSALQRLVAEILRRAAERKAAAGKIDFADMLLLAGRLVRGNMTVRRRENAACRILLVDEFQDTNPVQAGLVEAVSDLSDPRRRRFLVGDPKQSIYAFRGADVAVYERAIKDAVVHGAREYPLQRSWRSRPALLHFINRVSEQLFGNADEGDPLPDFAVRYQPRRDGLLAVRREQVGRGRAPADLLVLDVEGVPAGIARAREFRALARYLKRVVTGRAGIEVRGTGAPGAEEQPRTPRYGDIAILLRAFTHVNLLLRELELAGVPALLAKGEGFDQAPEVRDLVLGLRAACDWDDAIAFAAALRSPLVGLRDVTLARMARRGGRRPVLEPRAWWSGARVAEADWPPDEWRRLERFLRAGRWISARRARLEPAAALEALLQWTEFEAFHAARDQGRQALANIRELVAAGRRESAAGGDLFSFLRQFSLRLEEPTRTPPADLEHSAGDQVQVITVHGSKGLQFPLVVLADMGGAAPNRGGVWSLDRDCGFGLRLRPHRDAPLTHTTWSRLAQEALKERQREESRRLLYVALTRAEDQLILCGSGRAKESWRAWVEPLRPDLEAAGLLRVVTPEPGDLEPWGTEAGEVEKGENDAPSVSPAGPDPPAASGPLPAAPASVAPVSEPVPLEITTSGLEMLLQCPRRYHLSAVLGWEEFPRGDLALRSTCAESPSAGPAATSDHGSSRELGTLTHAILERVDFRRGVADPQGAVAEILPELVAADSDSGLLREATSAVQRFLSSAAGQQIAAAAWIEREVDFRLLLPATGKAPPLLLRGRIDLLLCATDGTLSIIDYKSGTSSAANPTRHAEQLGLYALAVERLLFSVPGGASKVAARCTPYLCYLGDRPPELLPVPRDSTLSARISEAAAGLLEWEQQRAWPGRPRNHCGQIGCGFVNGCHP